MTIKIKLRLCWASMLLYILLPSIFSGSYFYQAGSSVYEVIPSSNPNSQESLEDEVLARLAAADSCDVITEQFNKYTLNDIQQSTSPGKNYFFWFFLLNIFTQDIPLGWKPLQMWGPAQHTLLHKQ